MLIIGLVLMVIIRIVFKIPEEKLRKQFITRIIIAFIIQLFFLIVYRNELAMINRAVYYSDAEVYWKHTIQYLSGNIYYAHNDVYIWISYFIQKTSPFVWVGWNNIFNVLIVDLGIIMSAYIMYKENVKTLKECNNQNVTQFLCWTLFNPLVIYSLMRNLKDGVYLFFVCCIIYAYYKTKEKISKFKSFSFLIFTCIMAIVLYGIRPWAFITSLIALFIFISEMRVKKTYKIIFSIIISIFLLGLVNISSNFHRIITSTEMWIPIVLESSSNQSILEKVLSVPRLFIGPGPIRSLLGNQYFVFYTNTGNLMSFLGSSLWWIQLALMNSYLIKNGIKITRISGFNLYMLLNIISFITIYAMAYGGSSELRFRGVLYVLFSAWFFSQGYLKKNKLLLSISLLLLIIITIGGIVFG